MRTDYLMLIVAGLLIALMLLLSPRSDDRLLWQTRAKGWVLALLLRGSTLIALGNENGDAVLPDRVWAWDISDRE